MSPMTLLLLLFQNKKLMGTSPASNSQRVTVHEMATNRAIWRKVVELEVGNTGTDCASASSIEPEDPCGAELAGPSDTSGEEEPVPLPIVELKVENVGTDRADPSRTEVDDPSVAGHAVPSSTSNEDDTIPLWFPSVELVMEDLDTDPADPSSAKLAGLSGTSAEEELNFQSVEHEIESSDADRADPSSSELVGPSGTSGEDEPVLLLSVELVEEDLDSDPADLSSAELAGLSGTRTEEELNVQFVEDEIESADSDPVDPSSAKLAGPSGTSVEEELIPHPLVELETENANTVPADPSSINVADPSSAKLVGPSRTSVEEELILLYHMLKIGSLGTERADSSGPSDTSSEEELILPFVKLQIESVGTDHTDPSCTDPNGARLAAGPSGISGEEELNLPSLEVAVENVETDRAGLPSSAFADSSVAELAGFSRTSGEEVLILPSLDLVIENVGSDGVGPSSADLACPSGTSGEEEVIFQPNLELRKDSTKNDSGRTHFCRNGCRFEEESKRLGSSLNVLIQLGCECRGENSWICVNCLLNWFAPRLLVDKKMKCEICQTLLPESVQKLVLSTYADHTGGRTVFIDVVGARLEMEHERSSHDVHVQEQQSHSAWTNIRRYMCCDVNVDELPDAPHGDEDASDAPAPASPLPRISSALAQNPAPEAPAPTDEQPRPLQLVWTKIRRYMCYTMPAPE